jgi:hypothetical protein
VLSATLQPVADVAHLRRERNPVAGGAISRYEMRSRSGGRDHKPGGQQTMAMGGISDEAIKERAYHIWMREGCPHGRDFEHWVQAQVELEAEQPKGNGARKAKAAAPRATAAKAAKAPADKPARKPAARAKKKT